MTARRMIGMTVDCMPTGTVQAVTAQVAATTMNVAGMAARCIVAVAHCAVGYDVTPRSRLLKDTLLEIDSKSNIVI